MSLPPILDNKRHDAPSVFEPVALLREARRQKSLAITDVPGLCVFDPGAPEAFAEADPKLISMAKTALGEAAIRAHVGSSWTTDAPFRETAEAIEAARAKGAFAVEMEAAALYTFAKKRNAAVLCLAQVSNTMGLASQDFEKGEAQGAAHALQVLEVLAGNLR